MIHTSRSFDELKTQMIEIAKDKGTVASRKFGKEYCDAWKREVEAEKINLTMQRGMIGTREYNKQAKMLNMQINEMNRSAAAFNQMINALKKPDADPQ